MKLTIVYDNESWNGSLEADWGFACLVEAYGKTILFDTGANGSLLLKNMKKLNIDPADIEEIFISHAHWDHMGGLTDVLKIHPVKVYVPASFQGPGNPAEMVKIKSATKIHDNIFSTGELGNIEQSLVIKTDKGLAVIVGCSHPGVENILQAASRFGKPYALIGGLHGFNQFELVASLELICPTHCTQFGTEIKERYPEKYIGGGAGKVIEL